MLLYQVGDRRRQGRQLGELVFAGARSTRTAPSTWRISRSSIPDTARRGCRRPGRPPAGVITITDKDGDSDTASVGIGSRVRFDDDGPKANMDSKKHDACIIFDKSKDAAAGDGYPDGNANDDEAGDVKDDITYGAPILGKDLIFSSSSFRMDRAPRPIRWWSATAPTARSVRTRHPDFEPVAGLCALKSTTDRRHPDLPAPVRSRFRIGPSVRPPATWRLAVPRGKQQDNAGGGACARP